VDRYRSPVAKSVKAPVAAWFACACGLVLLAIAIYKVGVVERLDADLLGSLVIQRGSGAFRVANLFAHMADPLPLVVMLIAVCGLAFSLGRRREAVAAVVVVAGANLTTQVLKVLLAHPRYQPFLGSHQPWSTAFPSGHTTAAASIAVALLLVAPVRLREIAGLLGLALVAVVSGSVIALEWHYPSDVAGGILIAAGWGFAALAGLRAVRQLEREPDTQESRRLAISVK
jgi:membrane-associated phospholipid phosphatase